LGLNAATVGTTDLPDRPAVPRAYAWLVFALIFALLLSDYMSRQVLNAVFPLLKVEWGLSDTQLGSLSGVVALMVGILAFPISLAADRWGRVKSLAIMALLWSAATLACGLSAGYGQMLGARFLVGVGEAAYGSVGLAVVLSMFPAHLRASLTGAFTSGGMFGSVLGMALGGIVAARFGWRWAFVAMALFGIALVVLYALSVRERKVAPPARDAADETGTRIRFRSLLPGLFSAKSVVCAYIGSGLQLFIIGAILAWLPSYLNRYYGMPLDRASITAAVFVLLSGIGMIVCGIVTDRVSKVSPPRKIVVATAYSLGSLALLAVGFRLEPGTTQLVLLGAGIFIAAGTFAPAGAMVANLTHPSIHATAFATLTLANNLLGMAPGPIVTGMLADKFGLLAALQVVPFVSLGAAAAFLIARTSYFSDLGRVIDPREPTGGRGALVGARGRAAKA
jgi:MFS family permease